MNGFTAIIAFLIAAWLGYFVASRMLFA